MFLRQLGTLPLIQEEAYQAADSTDCDTREEGVDGQGQSISQENRYRSQDHGDRDHLRSDPALLSRTPSIVALRKGGKKVAVWAEIGVLQDGVDGLSRWIYEDVEIRYNSGKLSRRGG